MARLASLVLCALVLSPLACRSPTGQQDFMPLVPPAPSKRSDDFTPLVLPAPSKQSDDFTPLVPPAPSTRSEDLLPTLAPLAPLEEFEPPLQVQTVPVPGDEPVFLLTGSQDACPRVIFLHGRCCRGLGYVKSFERTGREHGGVLGLQGDILCSGVYRKYAPNPDAQDARVRRAFASLKGPAGPCKATTDLVLVGYSQGAYIAELMAWRFPERYSELILIGAPTAPMPARLRRARAVVTVSGELDAPFRIRAGAKALAAAGVPSTYLEMPGTRHGDMGDAERVMGEAFDWLEANARK
jgi:predicted esterase